MLAQCHATAAALGAKLKKEAEEREIIEWHIVEIVRRYCSIPGKRVIHRELVARYGHTISPKRVKKIMNGMRLVPSIPWRNPYKFDATHAHPQTAPDNLVNQNFFIAPRQVILTDITYLYYQKPLGTDKVSELFPQPEQASHKPFRQSLPATKEIRTPALPQWRGSGCG